VQIIRFCIANFSIYIPNNRKKVLFFDLVLNKTPGTYRNVKAEEGTCEVDPSRSAQPQALMKM
jgi:hypothetical protein